MNEAIQNITIMAVPFLLAVCAHELAHGWTADKLGDDTAKLSGRLTLNPLSHIDPLGALVFVMTQFIGWARPIPVNLLNLKDPKRDMIWIALAGPLSNLSIAVLCTVFYNFFQWFDPVYQYFTPPALFHEYPSLQNLGLFFKITVPVYWMIILSIKLNIVLAIFNLIPIPPLDGGRIMTGLLPSRHALGFSKIEPYGLFILIFLIFAGVIDAVIYPVIRSILALLLA